MSKKQKLSRRDRRHAAAIRRVKAKSKRASGGFNEKDLLTELENKRKAQLKRIAEKKKATYESRHRHNRSFYEEFKKDHNTSEIIKEMWNRGYKIRVDQYYKDFIDEHENLLTKDFIDEIMEDKFNREEQELKRIDDFWDDEFDPFASLL